MHDLCTTECGLELEVQLEAGDQSAARLAQLIIGYVGGTCMQKAVHGS